MDCSSDARIAYGIVLMGSWEYHETTEGFCLGEEYEDRFESFEEVLAHALGWTPDENGESSARSFLREQPFELITFGGIDSGDKIIAIRGTETWTGWLSAKDITAFVRGGTDKHDYAHWDKLLQDVIHKLGLAVEHQPGWWLMADTGSY